MSDTARPSESIASLYSEHHGWLQGWLRKKLNCNHQAADVAQDTFLKLLTGRSPQQIREPRALLTHIAKCLVVDHWRRQEVERAYLDSIAHLPEPQAPSPESQLLVIEAILQVDAMLSALPLRTREIFLLAQLEGLTLAQIAERTGASVITVRRHIQKALLACMSTLEQADGTR